jgi:hypothetical protein
MAAKKSDKVQNQSFATTFPDDLYPGQFDKVLCETYHFVAQCGISREFPDEEHPDEEHMTEALGHVLARSEIDDRSSSVRFVHGTVHDTVGSGRFVSVEVMMQRLGMEAWRKNFFVPLTVAEYDTKLASVIEKLVLDALKPLLCVDEKGLADWLMSTLREALFP